MPFLNKKVNIVLTKHIFYSKFTAETSNLNITSMKLLLSFLAAALAAFTATAQAADSARVRADIEFIASDELAGRMIGTPGLEKAGDYIIAELEKVGVKSFINYPGLVQDVPMAKTVVTSAKPIDFIVSVLTDTVDESTGQASKEQSVQIDPKHIVCIQGSDVYLDAPTVYLDVEHFEDITIELVSGKIVLFKRIRSLPRMGIIQFLELQRKVATIVQGKGGLGLITLFDTPLNNWMKVSSKIAKRIRVTDEYTETLPMFCMYGKDIAPENITYGVLETPDVVLEPITSRNIVGFIPGTDSTLANEWIVRSAHYDHIGIVEPDADGDSICNGARDNATGVASLLETARFLAEHPGRRPVMFCFFTAEEQGLQGSQFFVDHCPVSLSDIGFCLNTDNGGYSETTLVTMIGLEHLDKTGEVLLAVMKSGLSVGDDTGFKEQNLFVRSDHFNLVQHNVPALMLGMGRQGTGYEKLLATYHKPADNPETLDWSYVTKYCTAGNFVTQELANMDTLPVSTWDPPQ